MPYPPTTEPEAGDSFTELYQKLLLLLNQQSGGPFTGGYPATTAPAAGDSEAVTLAKFVRLFNRAPSVSISQNTTFGVPSDFATIAAAWDYLKGVNILGAAEVTIQVESSSLVLSGRKVFNHPQGAQIQILGNTSEPEDCVLDCTAMEYTNPSWEVEDDGVFAVSRGNVLRMDGFKIVGPGRDQVGLAALLAFGGGRLICGDNMVSEDFYFPLAAIDHAYARAWRIKIRNGADGNLFSYNGSVISAAYCDSRGAGGYYAECGALAEHCSSIWAPGGLFQDNAGAQIGVDYTSTFMANGATLRSTGAMLRGVRMVLADGMDLDGVTFDNVSAPRARMVNAESGTYGNPDSLGQIEMGRRLPYQLDDTPFRFAADLNEPAMLSVAQIYKAASYQGFRPNSDVYLIGNDGPTTQLKVGVAEGCVGGTVFLEGNATGAKVRRLNISNLPTSASGLSSGDLWNSSGTIKVV